MRTEILISTTTLLGFVLVLTRVGCVMFLIPLPGLRNGPDMARVVFSVALTFALMPSWPKHLPANMDMPMIAMWMMSEAALGLAIGLCISFLAEMLGMAAQIINIQSGYSYAMTIDPTTNAEAGYLLVFSQLASGLLLFAFGLERHIVRALAESLTTAPPGHFQLSNVTIDIVCRSASMIFSTGLKLALPVVTLLVMADLVFALLGRVTPHLQVLTITFAAKMLLAVGLLAWILVLAPHLFGDEAKRLVQAMYAVIR